MARFYWYYSCTRFNEQIMQILEARKKNDFWREFF